MTSLLLLLLYLLSALLSPGEPFLHPPHGPPIRKQGEISPPEEPCHFPFSYQRKLHYSCIQDSFLNPLRWCATTENYDRDRKWRPCGKEEKPRGHCDHNPCQNGGVCEARRTGFHCICPAGFHGRHCEKENCLVGQGLLHIGREDVWVRQQPAGLEECRCAGKKLLCKHIRAKACPRNPCLNGGLCVELKHKRSCACSERFSGPLCDIDHTQICYSGNGQTYRGMAHLSSSGTPCLPWDSPYLVNEYSSSLANAVNLGLGEHAFCRNPDNDSQPWCYVVRDMQLSWEFCNIVRCQLHAGGDMVVETGAIQHDKPDRKPQNKTESSPPPATSSPLLTTATSPVCGLRYTKTTSSRKRIVGGMVALPGSHPYIAAMYIGDQFCGGSLIASCWILTAAHCLDFRPNAAKISVVLGQTRYNTSTDGTMKFQVQYYQMHEDYSEITKEHDIALVRLKEKTPGHCVEFSHSVLPVCLPSSLDIPDDSKQCQIAGWGHMYEGADKLSLYLQEADIPIIPHETCCSKEVHGERITQGMLCAGFLEGRTDACQGDSGGPLVCEDQGKAILHGIISWGTGCALENKPGVYTNVAHYLDWIQRHMH